MRSMFLGIGLLAFAQAQTTESPADCAAQPLGAGPVPSPDDASTFSSSTAFSNTANTAMTPPGYSKVFTNQAAAVQGSPYLGYTTLTSYDPSGCSALCNNNITGCVGFNTYFERDPTVNPAFTCQNPPSTTNIKCAFFGNAFTASNATNNGQWRYNFQVVIAGSNGYTRNAGPSPPPPGAGTKPSPGPGPQPAPGPGTQPAPGPGTQPAPGPGTQPAPGPGTQPAPGPGAQPAPGPGAQPAPGPGAHPGPKFRIRR